MKFRPRTYATLTAIAAAFSMVVFFYTPVVAAEPPYFSSQTETNQGDQWTSMEQNIIFAYDTQAILWATRDPDAPKDGLGWSSRKGITHSYVSYREVGEQDWSTETETIFNSNLGFWGRWSWVYPCQYIAVNGIYEIKLISEDTDGFRCEEVYTIEVDLDSDQDGYADVVDNCPATPNGALAGTCYNYYTQESRGSCMTDTECQDAPSKWYKWCDTFQGDLDGNGTGDVCEGPQDSDQDGYDDDEDNCPGTPNQGQQDADDDGTGDACDKDTIYGYISGEFKEDVEVNISIVTDYGEEIIDVLITDEDGYYAIGDLEDNRYEVTPEESDYIFSPNSAYVQISTDR